jgi:hypothetical protein
VNLRFSAKGECAAGWFSPFCLESRVHVPGLDRSHSLLARRQDLSYHFRCLLRPIHRRLVSVQRAIPDSFFGVEFTGRSSVAPTFCWLFPVDLLGPLVFSPTCSSVPLGCTAPTSLHFSVGAASGVLHLIFCSPVQLSADILHTGVPLTMAQRWWPLYSSCSRVSRQEQALQELPSLTVFVSISLDFFCQVHVWIVAGTHSGLVLEISDQKARGFLVSIALKRLFLKHVRKLFGQMPVRT